MVGPRSASAAPDRVGPASRSHRRRSKKIEEILRAAARLLAERGYAATNLDEIADALDVSKASLYHYFPSKEALVIAALERIGADVQERLVTAASQPLPARERLRALIREQVLVLTRDMPAEAPLFLNGQQLPDVVRERFRKIVDRHDAVFRSVIEQGVERGEFHVADIGVARLLMHGALNFIPAWYRQTRRLPPERLANVVSTLILRLFEGSAE